MREQRHVGYMDFEDGPRSMARRIQALGLERDAIEELFTYIRPEEPFGDSAKRALNDSFDAVEFSLIVIDGITEAMGLLGYGIKENDEVARFLAELIRPLVLSGACVLLLDHVVKDSASRSTRFAIGAQHKLAAIDGAAYSVQRGARFGRNRNGSAVLNLQKDRPGWIRDHTVSKREQEQAAFVRFESRADAVQVIIDAPNESEHPVIDASVSPALLERASRAIEGAREFNTQTEFKRAVGGNKQRATEAIEQLVRAGDVEAIPTPTRSDGTPQRVAYRHLHPYRASPKPTASPGRPEESGKAASP